MTESGKIYVAGPRPELEGNEFWIYILGASRSKYEEVLLWCVEHCKNTWQYTYIEGPHFCRPVNLKERTPPPADAAGILGYAGNGSYGLHLKLCFEQKTDAAHFKLVWG